MSGTLALIEEWRKALPSEPPHGAGILAVPVSMGELFVLADMVRKDERGRALDAAREAVMASGGHHERCICDECYGTAAAVAAIDALREEKK